MTKATTILLLALLLPAVSFGWNLAPCDTEIEAKQLRFEQALRTAKPGAPDYVPHPFPTTVDEVVDDFLYQYRRVWSDKEPESLPHEERSLLSLLDREQARFEILRVANWASIRCGPRRKRDFYHLVRVFAHETGEEIARAGVDNSGHLNLWTHSSPESELQLILTLTEGRRTLASMFGRTGGDPQYVTTSALLQCSILRPCIALRAGAGGALILKGQELFRIEEGVERFSLRSDLKTPEQKSDVIRDLADRNSLLVSLGGYVYAAAVRVPPVQ